MFTGLVAELGLVKEITKGRALPSFKSVRPNWLHS